MAAGSPNEHRARVILSIAGACIAGVPAAASAQSQMSRAEAAQLYTAAGFTIADNRALNTCGQPAKPRVTFVDINGDKRPEALFIDENVQCYAPAGRYFAVLANEGGRWRAVLSGNGSIQALASRSGGWLDMQVTEGSCKRNFRHSGQAYAATSACPGQALAGGPAPGAAPPVTASAAAPAAPRPASATVSPGDASAPAKLQAADEAAAFKAAGFTKRGGTWRNCDDPTPTSAAGQIDQVTDLNGDGRPEVVIIEGGTYCYGHTSQAYWLVSRQADGSWKLMTHNTGIAEFLKTKGADGWPDISVGGPGFCFPVERWNGRAYRQQRWEYEGKACKPPR